MNDADRDLATQYVLDQLEPRERTLFEARVLAEPELAALVDEIEEALAQTVQNLPGRTPPAALFDRIEARLDSAPVGAAVATSAAPRGWAAYLGWGLAATIAVSLAILAAQTFRPRPQSVVVVVGLDADRSTLRQLTLDAKSPDTDARFIQLAALAQDLWQKPRSPASGGHRGYALFDPTSHQGFIAIEQLPPPPSQQRYCLWLVDPATGQVRPAGTLPVSSAERGLFSFAVDPADVPQSNRLNFFLTLEEATSPPAPQRPQGRVVLGSQTL